MASSSKKCATAPAAHKTAAQVMILLLETIEPLCLATAASAWLCLQLGETPESRRDRPAFDWSGAAFACHALVRCDWPFCSGMSDPSDLMPTPAPQLCCTSRLWAAQWYEGLSVPQDRTC